MKRQTRVGLASAAVATFIPTISATAFDGSNPIWFFVPAIPIFAASLGAAMILLLPLVLLPLEKHITRFLDWAWLDENRM